MKKSKPKVVQEFFTIWIDPPFHTEGRFVKDQRSVTIPYVKFRGNDFFEAFKSGARVICEIKFDAQFTDPAQSLVVGHIHISRISAAPKVKRKSNRVKKARG